MSARLTLIYLPGDPIFWHFGLSGLHIGIGPPSKADISGAATVKDAPTKPTTTIIHFTARFMGVSFSWEIPLGEEPHGRNSMASYQSNPKQHFRNFANTEKNVVVVLFSCKYQHLHFTNRAAKTAR